MQISEEMIIIGFDLIKEDGSCSEETLDYACDRQLQLIESFTSFGNMDNVDITNFRTWIAENFNEPLATHLIGIYKWDLIDLHFRHINNYYKLS